jgi:hypothetical protein
VNFVAFIKKDQMNPTVLVPCDVSPHAGLALGSDVLRATLSRADAWVARLVCRAFRDRCPRGPCRLISIFASPARCQLAFDLGYGDLDFCYCAGRAGRLDLLKWALARGRLRHSAHNGAAAGGHVAVLEWACDLGGEWRPDEACDAAARNDRIEVLLWLVNECCFLQGRVGESARREAFTVRECLSAGGHGELARQLPWPSRWEDKSAARRFRPTAGGAHVLVRGSEADTPGCRIG